MAKVPRPPAKKPVPGKGPKLKPLTCQEAWRTVREHFLPVDVGRLEELFAEWWEEARMKARAPKASSKAWQAYARELAGLGMQKFAFLLRKARLKGWQGLDWRYVAKDWEQGGDAELDSDSEGPLPAWLTDNSKGSA